MEDEIYERDDGKEDNSNDGMDDATPRPSVLAAGPDPRRRWRRRGSALLGAALFGIALLAAACSSGPSNPGVAGSASSSPSGSSSANPASSGSGSDSSRQTALLAYAQCMRAHGVTNFPDPNSQGGFLFQGNGGPNPDNPTFQAAQKACRSKIPAPTKAQQEQMTQNALKMSECMRNHGIKDFPDPNISGGHVSLKINGSPGSDLNPNNPQFQRAQNACSRYAPKGAMKSGSGSNSSGATFGAPR